MDFAFVMSDLSSAQRRLEQTLGAVATTVRCVHEEVRWLTDAIRRDTVCNWTLTGHKAATSRSSSRSHVENAECDVVSPRYTAFHAALTKAVGPEPETPNHVVSLHLPSTWPDMPLRSLMQREELSEEEVRSTVMAQFEDSKPATRRKPFSKSGSLTFGNQKSHFSGVFNPNSTWHMFFDAISLVVLVADLTYTPFYLAWDEEASGFVLAFIWFTPFFWSIDMTIAARTGFHHDGELVMDPVVVSRHYAQSWLFPDLVIVVCDWVSLLFEVLGSEDSREFDFVRLVKVMRLSRLVKVLGLIRLSILCRLLSDWIDRALSDGLRLFLKVMAVFVIILWASHVICCAWFFVGRAAPTDTGLRWVSSLRASDTYAEFGCSFEYLSAFHWTMAQLTLGANEVNANNSIERIFNIVMLLFGLLLSSSLVGSLSAAMIDYQQQQSDRDQKFRSLRRFLWQHGVEHNVAMRVKQQVEKRFQTQGEEILREDDVPVLGLVSASLRGELNVNIYLPFLDHPIFLLWTQLSKKTVETLCIEAVDFAFLQAHDELFVAGAMCQHAYQLIRGEITYQQEPETSGVSESESFPVDVKTWMCEAALWTEWIHVGTALAWTRCQLLRVSAEGLAKCMRKHALIMGITQEYGICFQRSMANSRPPIWPNDLVVPFTSFHEVIHSMPSEYQMAIGLAALEKASHNDIFALAKRARRFSAVQRGHDVHDVNQRFKDLKVEVLTGKSTVLINETGDLERVVSLVAFNIKRWDGKVFAQLGKVENGTLSGSCQLPGSKQRSGEVCADAVYRILKTKLSLLGLDDIELINLQQKVEIKESGKFKVRTKYTKTECQVMLTRPVQAPICRTGARLWGKSQSSPPDFDWLETIEAYCVFDTTGGKTVQFFAWLTQDQFNALSVAGETPILQWLSSLQTVEEDATPSTFAYDGAPVKLVLWI